MHAFEAPACNFIKKETLAQLFSCEFWEIFKNTFLTEHPWWLLLNIYLSCYKWSNSVKFGGIGPDDSNEYISYETLCATWCHLRS